MRHLCFVVVAAHLTMGTRTNGAALDPNRINQLIVQGRFADEEPKLVAIFSTEPLADSRGRLSEYLTLRQLKTLHRSPTHVVLGLHSKKPTASGRCDYFFGTRYDPQMPWNDGREFAWQSWSRYPPDIWDNVAVGVLPSSSKTADEIATITNVTFRINSQLLFDSRKNQSFPNRHSVDFSLVPKPLMKKRGGVSLINLSSTMKKFRNSYYELNDNTLLLAAYSDLGQGDRVKYANRGVNWCSEFCSYLYRSHGIPSPDPNKADVNWLVMRKFFLRTGTIYPAREVSSWSDKKKIETIPPGSFVTIPTADWKNTHSVLFTKWVSDGKNPISKFTAVSGNNAGVVCAHSPIGLPTSEFIQTIPKADLDDFDERIYFAVPNVFRPD